MWIQPKIARITAVHQFHQISWKDMRHFHFILFLFMGQGAVWTGDISICDKLCCPGVNTNMSHHCWAGKANGLVVLIFPPFVSVVACLSDGLELWSSGTDPSDHVIVKAFQIWATSMAGLQSRLTDQQLCHDVHYVVLLSFAESFMYASWNDSWQELITEHAVAGVEISSSTSQILVTD